MDSEYYMVVIATVPWDNEAKTQMLEALCRAAVECSVTFEKPDPLVAMVEANDVVPRYVADELGLDFDTVTAKRVRWRIRELRMRDEAHNMHELMESTSAQLAEALGISPEEMSWSELLDEVRKKRRA